MRGFTLVEIVAALALLGLLAALAGVGFHSLRAPDAAEALHGLVEARAQAVREGRTVTWEHDGQHVHFAPDGSSSGGLLELDGLFVTVDPLTGAVDALE